MFTFNLIKFSKEYGKFIKIGLPILGSQLGDVWNDNSRLHYGWLLQF